MERVFSAGSNSDPGRQTNKRLQGKVGDPRPLFRLRSEPEGIRPVSIDSIKIAFPHVGGTELQEAIRIRRPASVKKIPCFIRCRHPCAGQDEGIV